MKNKFIDSIMRIIIFIIIATVGTSALAATYYVRPDGDDANPGTNNTVAGAWRSIDRGQPTWLRESCGAGDTTIAVVKTTQFPERGILRIGKSEVTYTGKTLQSFTGCSNVPAAKASTFVYSSGRVCPGSGDTVIVEPGIYTLDYKKHPQFLSNIGLAVVMIAKGGTEDAPLIFRGNGLPVVDAQSENNVKSFFVHGNYVQIDAFDIRCGGFWSGWTRGVKVLNSRFHEGQYALSFAYARDIEIAFNKIYDFKGAWTVSGIVLNQCSSGRIYNNTIISSVSGITINGGKNIDVGNNLIAWCQTGIKYGSGRKPENCNLHNNNLWWIRGGIWLQRDDNRKSDFYYVNCQPGTNDTSVDPMIVNWNPAKPGFLDYHDDSPAVTNGEVLFGAGKKYGKYPESGNMPTENLIFNPSFEAGFTGWKIDTWNNFLPGQAGWRIVKRGNINDGQCLYIYEHPEKGKRINVRVRSQNFRYTRGRALTISCLAKADSEKTLLNIGFTVPSWQNKSGVSTKISLTKEWKRYSYTVILPDRFPDYAAATFTSYNGQYWIDDIKVEEGAHATSFSPNIEFIANWRPGLLIPPGEKLSGYIINRQTNPVHGQITGCLIAPLQGKVAELKKRFTVDAESRVPISISLPENLDGGIFLFKYAFEIKGKKSADKYIRFSIGMHPQPDGRNHDFFATTPGYSSILTDTPLLKQQMESLATLGIGTLHLYMGYKRINEILANSKIDKIVDTAGEYGIQWLFTPSDARALTGKSTWAPGPGLVGTDAIEYKRSELEGGRLTPPQLTVWDDVIAMLVKKMKGRVKYYEVLNEPNCFLDGSEYTNILCRTSKIIRSIDSNAHIVAGSVVNAVRKDLWNKTMATPASTFDEFSYHPYRFGLTNPERENMSYRADILRAKKDLAAHGHPVKIWLTEEGMGPALNETRCIGRRLGYSATVRRLDFGEGEILQAQYAARMYATALGENGAGYNYHTVNGLVQDSVMSPMLALKAIHTMASVLGDAEPIGQININYNYICYLFRNEDKITAVIWAKDAEYATPVSIVLKGVGRLTGVNLFGFSMKLKKQALKDEIEFSIGKELIYLTFSKMPAFKVSEILRNGFDNIL